MPYRHKASEAYVEFIHRDKGVVEAPACSIEVEFKLSDGGVEFKDHLKDVLPRGAWHYDPPTHRWFILPQYLLQAKQVACQHFKHVYETEGDVTTDVVSGTSTEQKGLF